MSIKTKVGNRKELANIISQFTGDQVRYKGAPTFAYVVGSFTVVRDGSIETEDAEQETRLREHLHILGFIDEPTEEPEVTQLDIEVPTDGMSGVMLRNILFMVYSKQYLLNKVTGAETFSVPETLVDELKDADGISSEDFILRVSDVKGLRFERDKVAFTYPISDDPNKNKAYAEISAFMVTMARHAKRINPKEQKPDNEKYYLRVWLLRLGLTGLGGKESRKALLKGLKGHTAFRTPEDEMKHKARLAEKKAHGKNDVGTSASD
jgi:hypothetical protein